MDDEEHIIRLSIETKKKNVPTRNDIYDYDECIKLKFLRLIDIFHGAANL